MSLQGHRSFHLPSHIRQQCAVYKVFVPPEMIDHYLPDRLVAYATPTRINLIRRHFFFSPSASRYTRSTFDDYIDQLANFVSLDNFLRQVSRETDALVRYNYVLLDDYLIFIRMPYLLSKTYTPLCKHITISSRARTVRFAGEIWSDGRGQFFVNNNSGTYQPVDALLPAAVQIFRDLSPRTSFQEMSFRISALPPINERF